MKFLSFTFGLMVIPTLEQALDCGEARVTSSFGICIQPQYIEGCSIYYSEAQCSSCELGYKLNKDRRCDAVFSINTHRDYKLPGCLIRNQFNKHHCSKCANGYFIRNGLCAKGVRNCSKHNSVNDCLECMRDYSLILNQCHQNPILGCRKLKQQNMCQLCEFPFTLNEHNTCSIENCKDYNDYGCVNCECGFYLHQDRTCRKMTPGCLRYSRGRCRDCLKHFRLKGNFCEMEGCLIQLDGECLTCQDKYQKVDYGCVFKNCESWANNQCQQCSEGYKRSKKGVCVKAQPILCKK